MAEAGDDKPIPVLVADLLGSDLAVRAIAQAELARRPHRDTIPLLLDAIAEGNVLQKEAALCAIGAIGPAATEAIPVLLDLLKCDPPLCEDPLVDIGFPSKRVCGTLAEIGASAIPEVVALFREGVASTRFRTVHTLGLLSIRTDEAIPFLLDGLRDGERWVRAETLLFVCRLGLRARHWISHVRDAAHDSDLIVRLRAQIALNAIDSRFPYVKDKWLREIAGLLRGGDRAFRIKCAETLELVGGEAARLLPILLKRLNDPQIPPECNAIASLARVDSAVIDTLQQLLDPKKEMVVANVAFTLGMLGLSARSALPKLMEVCGSDSRSVRRSALSAINAIGASGRDAQEFISVAEALMKAHCQLQCSDLEGNDSFIVCTIVDTLGRLDCPSETDRVKAMKVVACATFHPEQFVREKAVGQLQLTDVRVGVRTEENECRCPIKHITVNKACDAVLASVAMVCRVPYQEILGLADVKNMCIAIESLTRRHWRVVRYGFFGSERLARVFQGTEPLPMTEPVVVAIRHPCVWWKARTLVLFGEIVHDPLFPNSYFLRDYAYRNWKVAALCVPG